MFEFEAYTGASVRQFDFNPPILGFQLPGYPEFSTQDSLQKVNF